MSSTPKTDVPADLEAQDSQDSKESIKKLEQASPRKISPAADSYEADPEDGREDGSTEELVKAKPSPSHRLLRRVFTIILIWALIAYSIAAYVISWPSPNATALLVMECVAMFIFLCSYIGRRHSKEITAFLSSTEQFFYDMGRKTAFKVIVIVVLAAAILAIVLYEVWGEFERLISACGLVFFIAAGYLFSWKRKHVNWRPVVWGFLLQFVFAYIILQTDWGRSAFTFLGEQVTAFLNYSQAGAEFLFGYLSKPLEISPDLTLFAPFAFFVLPLIIFFSAVTFILYYLGVLQAVIEVIARVMALTMGTSASESLNAAGNIFIGQTEAPLLVRPFLKDMTMSELHAVMTGGFSTIAGSVLGAYISFGVPAEHLLAASIMSAPAALALSKLIYPETEESKTKSTADKPIEVAPDEASNVIEAATNGTTVAVTLVANIAAMLIAFLAILAALNNWVGFFGRLVGWEEASFDRLVGYLMYPVACIMGVPLVDCERVGYLIGIKVFANEFVAYLKLAEFITAGNLTKRAEVIATYALCGFSNFASLGVQVGGLSPMAPNRKKDLTTLVFSAMIGGNMACFMTACIAGFFS